MKLDVIERARRYLQTLPDAVAGQGGHSATFRAATVLVNGFALDETTALPLLEAWNASHCHPAWKPGELQHKLRSAAKATHANPRGHLLGSDPPPPAGPALRGTNPPPLPPLPPQWPARDHDRIRSIALTGAALADLHEISPLSPDDLDAEGFIDALFPGNPLLCVSQGKKVNAAETRRRENFRGTLAGRSFIVPNPMSGPTGETQLGRPSPRSLLNTGPRHFLVIECDFSPGSEAKPSPDAPLLCELAKAGKTVADLCAAVLLHLAAFAPLALAVHSGGKSLHGWFFAVGHELQRLHAFMRYSVALGADPATWTRNQFVRLPGGTRDGGARQTVFFFNPGVIR